MFLVGLTGGIASGKSTVSAMLQKLGVEVIDADKVAREVVEVGTPGLAQIVDKFGDQILDSDRGLSRSALAEIVFSDNGRRKDLERILHPLIRARTMQLMAESKTDIVVYEVPLLVEAKVDYPFDLVLTVEAGVENQIQRLMSARGMSRDQALSRIMAQASESERVARADIRLNGDLSLISLEQSVGELFKNIQLQATKKARDGKN